MNIFRSEEKFIWKEYGDIQDKYNKLNSSRKLRQIFFFAPLVLILVIPFEDYTKEMMYGRMNRLGLFKVIDQEVK